ncbi:response regulator transcription factor [Gracilibacillus kekensis]|uniref:Two-component system, response regulator YesN n=1 Tax=Gracilibacillus kekensis TaxID=1027249 RepID=A0A1M7QUD4_9BACI|nr:response regulator [Gracilibacillus kekensis]SHN35055.1 two-component system, response regulator YesN [Gracilibacillus kekensis]
MQLLIVDDHAHLVDELVYTIDWDNIGVHSVLPAYSAKEALSIAQLNQIDIVITDIKMPGMTGLEMIKEMRKSNHSIKFIIITGFNKFEYAKTALQNEVSEYLLKPVSEEELISVVDILIKKIKEEKSHEVSFSHAMDSIRENLSNWRADILLNVLYGKAGDPIKLDEQFKKYKLDFQSNDQVYLIAIRIDEIPMKFDLNDVSYIEYSIKNIVEEILAVKFFCWSAIDHQGFLMFVIKKKEVIDDEGILFNLERDLLQIKDSVKKYIKSSVSIYSSDAGSLINNLPGMYKQALVSLLKSLDNNIVYIDKSNGITNDEKIFEFQSLYEPPTLTQLLEANDWMGAENKLQKIFHELNSRKQINILEAYYLILSSFIYIAHKNSFSLPEIIGGDMNEIFEGKKLSSVNHLSEWIYSIFNRIKIVITDESNESNQSRSMIVRKVQHYIEANISRDLSLKQIADQVYLHPVYLSRLYKEEKDEGISDYITRRKIERGAQMLKHTNLKIYHIADELGYQNANYFSKIFKEHFGMTPNAYRKL